MRDGLPPKVEERVDWLYLDPPAPAFEGLPDQLRVVSWQDDVLVAVLDVRILKRYLGLLLVQIDWVAVEICGRLLCLAQLLGEAMRHCCATKSALHQELASIL